MDLAVHASILLKGLTTAGAYALYKKSFADDLNSEAARNRRHLRGHPRLRPDAESQTTAPQW